MNGLTIAAQGLDNIVNDPAWQVQGAGDFDGDGKADIMWRSTATGEHYLYQMNGGPSVAQGLLTIGSSAPVWQVKGIGDFDGDGKADILWRSTATGEDYVYFMNGWAIASQGSLNTVPDTNWMPRSATTL